MKINVQLDESSLRTVQSILRTTPLSQQYEFLVFGSRARQAATAFSDIDIALRGKKPAELTDIALLNEQFELSGLPYKVDVIDLMHVNKAMRQEVAIHGQKVLL